VHAEAAKMIPDTKARLTKAAEELRELMVCSTLPFENYRSSEADDDDDPSPSSSLASQGETESEVSETSEYKAADEALQSYYELHGGQLVMEAESEPKDIREDDF
jgi:hypothetical protein